MQLLSRKYTLSLENPCKEDWDKMYPAAGGRFCDACAKNVVDFTGMTEKEISAYLRNKKGAGCGRFEISQLQKQYVIRPQIKFPFHQRFFSYLLTFFVSGALVNKASAQRDTTALVQSDTIPPIAGLDSALLQADSVAIAQTGSLNCKDSLSIETVVAVDFQVDPIMISGTIVSGGFWIDDRKTEEPSFLQFFKKKVYDSLAVVSKKNGMVEKQQIPAKPEKPGKPAKKDTTVVSALLPDELKRKGNKKA